MRNKKKNKREKKNHFKRQKIIIKNTVQTQFWDEKKICKIERHNYKKQSQNCTI